MDIRCTNCGEPWDSYHMLHDEIWEIADGSDYGSFPDRMIHKRWKANHKLTPALRKRFAAKGWKFGQTVCTIFHCPACPKELTPQQHEKSLDRQAIAEAISDIMGDDIDGIISASEDYLTD